MGDRAESDAAAIRKDAFADNTYAYAFISPTNNAKDFASGCL